MSKKEFFVPFDIDRAKAGEKVKTANGNDVRIICYDLRGDDTHPIVALVQHKTLCREEMFTYSKTGQWMDDCTSSNDLRIVEERDEQERWLDRMDGKVKGWCLAYNGKAVKASSNDKEKGFWKSIFATKKQAQSAAAAALISQIIANDERYGGVVTNEEWATNGLTKFVVCRQQNHLRCVEEETTFVFLAFHTAAQRELFLQENFDLVLQYYML